MAGRQMSMLGAGEVNSRMSVQPRKRQSMAPSGRKSVGGRKSVAPSRKSTGGGARKSMAAGRRSIIGDEVPRRMADPRPIKDKAFQDQAIKQVVRYLVENSACTSPLSARLSHSRCLSLCTGLSSASRRRLLMLARVLLLQTTTTRSARRF